MADAQVPVLDSDEQLRSEMLDLRQSVLLGFLWGVLAIAWIWYAYNLAIERHFYFNSIIIIGISLASTITYRIHHYHYSTACSLLVFLMLLVHVMVVVAYPGPVTVAAGLSLIIVANALQGHLWSLATTIATLSISLYAWRFSVRGPAFDVTVTLMAIVVYALTWVSCWLATRPLRTSVQWAISGWLHARESLEEVQKRRAELYRAVRALAEANSRIDRMNHELVMARAEAEAARAQKARFAAAVSHELRGPLSLILGFSRFMVLSPERYEEPLPPSYYPDVDAIYRNAQHMAALVDDVLDLAQIEVDRLPLVKDQVDLEVDVAQRAVDIVRPLAERKGLALYLEGAGDLPPVIADQVRLRQVLLNLLTNAIRATVQGEIVVKIQRRDDCLLVSVRDTGPGIAPEDIPRLFQGFSSVPYAERRQSRGSGLGLSISRELIVLHGGEIWVESELGVGSTFYLTVPLPGVRTSGALVRTPDLPHAQTTARSCLIVHDDPGIIRFLARHMGGYRIVGAPDEREVVNLAEGIHPAAIVTSHERQEGVARVVSGLPYDIPLITCGLPQLTNQGSLQGVATYLVKPIMPDVIESVMRQLGRDGETVVLLVDDDPDAVRLLESLLMAVPRPYQILRAYDGVEALQQMRNVTPDVVFLDLVMPRMSGEEVIAEMRADARLSCVPIVAISAHDWAERPLSVATPISVYCRKEVGIGRMAHCLRALLDSLNAEYLPEPIPQ